MCYARKITKKILKGVKYYKISNFEKPILLKAKIKSKYNRIKKSRTTYDQLRIYFQSKYIGYSLKFQKFKIDQPTKI